MHVDRVKISYQETHIDLHVNTFPCMHVVQWYIYRHDISVEITQVLLLIKYVKLFLSASVMVPVRVIVFNFMLVSVLFWVGKNKISADGLCL